MPNPNTLKDDDEIDLSTAISADAELTGPAGKQTTAGSYVLIAALAFIWGSSFILMKRGLTLLSPLEIGALRIATAGLALAPLSLPRLRRIPRRYVPYLVLSGVVGNFIPAFLFATAGTRLSSALSGSLNALSPLFTVLVGVLAFRQKATLLGWLGIGVGLLGALALSLSKVGAGGLDVNGYAAFIVLATLLYAININMVKRFLADVDAITISSVSLLPVGLIALIFLFLGTPFVQTVSSVPLAQAAFPVGCILALGAVGTAFALILFNRLLKQTTALVASTVTYLMPAVSLLWGVLDGERIMAWHYLGLAGIFCGLVLARR